MEDNKITKEQKEYEDNFKKKTGMSVEEYIEENVRLNFKTQIKAISEYSKSHGNMSVKDMIQEIKDKKSGLSRANRDLLLALNADTLKKWI